MRRPLLLSTGLAAALTLALSPVLVGTASAAPGPGHAKPAAAAAVAKRAAKPAKPAKTRHLSVVGTISATATVATASATPTATVTITVAVPRHGKQRATSVRLAVGPKAVVVRNGRRVAASALQVRDRVVVLATQTGTGPVTVSRVVATGRRR